MGLNGRTVGGGQKRVRYRQETRVHASHCDPAGLLLMSRYFLLTNRLVEDWFGDALQYSFAQMHLVDGQGVPTTQLDFRLHHPLRAGELLELGLTVRAIGRRHFVLHVCGRSGLELSFEVEVTLVFVTLTAARPRSADI